MNTIGIKDVKNLTDSQADRVVALAVEALATDLEEVEDWRVSAENCPLRCRMPQRVALIALWRVESASYLHKDGHANAKSIIASV